MQFYKQLRAALKNSRLSQKELAENLNISTVSISQYLSGKCSPTGANFEKLRAFISENLGVEIPKIKKYTHILNAKEAAEKFGIPARTLRELAKTGKFEWAVAYKGTGRKNIYRFFTKQLEKWLEKGKENEENEKISETAEILL